MKVKDRIALLATLDHSTKLMVLTFICGHHGLMFGECKPSTAFLLDYPATRHQALLTSCPSLPGAYSIIDLTPTPQSLNPCTSPHTPAQITRSCAVHENFYLLPCTSTHLIRSFFHFVSCIPPASTFLFYNSSLTPSSTLHHWRF